MRTKKAVSAEAFVFLIVFVGGFTAIASVMGVSNMLNTMINTSFSLLINVCFYIMAIAVLTGALGGILTEFGVVELVNKLISPIMKPIYGLPGSASLGIITTYLSDNPAILTLASDKKFAKHFTQRQIVTLCNLGTAFGMGLIVNTYFIAHAPKGESYLVPVLMGLVGAVVGSIVSVRLMQWLSRPLIDEEPDFHETLQKTAHVREIREGALFSRVLDSLLDGGKNGVQMGLLIIPGVLIVSTFIFILTCGPSADGSYTGAAKEGVALLPWIGTKLSFILTPLFGFSSPQAIAFPITSLGSAGAALSLIPHFQEAGYIGKVDIAVFTAMGMCWSGYLSTHISMMDSLGYRKLATKAIFSHTIAGLCAGIVAHLLMILV